MLEKSAEALRKVEIRQRLGYYLMKDPGGDPGGTTRGEGAKRTRNKYATTAVVFNT